MSCRLGAAASEFHERPSSLICGLQLSSESVLKNRHALRSGPRRISIVFAIEKKPVDLAKGWLAADLDMVFRNVTFSVSLVAMLSHPGVSGILCSSRGMDRLS